jgi:hypothetical protein
VNRIKKVEQKIYNSAALDELSPSKNKKEDPKVTIQEFETLKAKFQELKTDYFTKMY